MNRYSLTTLLCIGWFSFTAGVIVDTYYSQSHTTQVQAEVKDIPQKDQEIDVDNLCATYIRPDVFQPPAK